jgi:hypothetical protein
MIFIHSRGVYNYARPGVLGLPSGKFGETLITTLQVHPDGLSKRRLYCATNALIPHDADHVLKALIEEGKIVKIEKKKDRYVTT